MRFSALTNRIFGRSQESMSSLISKPSSVRLFGYDDIFLKDFVEICATGSLSLLIISGVPDSETLSDAWEKIVEENSKHNGDNQYSSFQQLNKSAAELEAEFTIIETSLTILWYKVDWAIINDLRDRGYEVATTPGNYGTTDEAYAESIKRIRAKIGHLKTRAEKRRKEIERRFGNKDKDKRTNIYECIGSLELALGWSVGDADKMTLARYNVLKRGAKEKNKAGEDKSQSNGRNRRR